MNTYNASLFETFTRLTGIRVRFCESVRNFTDLSVELQSAIENGKISGWFDQDARTIRLYTGRDNSLDVRVRESRLAANALYIALGRLGWDGLFREERRNAVMLNMKGKIELEGMYRLESLLDTASVNPVLEKVKWSEDNNYSSALSMFLSGLFGFQNTETLERGIRGGMIANYNKLIDERRKSGDRSVICEQIKSALYNENENGFINLGTRPHAMMRVGYKGMDMLVRPHILRSLLHRSGLDKETFAERFVEALASPLAVFESTRLSEATNQFPYEVVLNLPDKSGGYLTLVVNRPEAVAEEFLKGKHQEILLYSTYWSNLSRLAYHINNNKAKNLAERGGEGSRDFELVRLLEKNETGPEAGVNAATVVRSLRIDANVINSFFNSKYFTENFSKVEEKLQMMDVISRKLEEGDKLQNTEKPIQKRVEEKPILSAMERLNKPIDESKIISEADKRKLREMKIRTFQDLRNATDNRLRKDFSRAQVDSFECALEELGLSFYTRPGTISVDEFNLLTEKEKQRKSFEDSVIALQYTSREYIKVENMPLPIHLDHTPIEGEAGVQMLVKLASRARKWDWAPVFISTTQMAEIGLSPLDKAEPTHVKENGEWVSYYNIMDTDLLKANPALFKKESNYMDNECIAGLPYTERILSVMLSIRDEIGAPIKGPAATEGLKKQAAGMFSYYGKEYTENVRKDIADSIADYHIGNTEGKIIGDPESYKLATESAMFMADRLNAVGIITVVDRDGQINAGTNETFRRPDSTIYGYQMGNTIFLTPEGINPNTPIHEYAHIWAKAYEKLHPEEWASLKDELRALPLWEVIRSSDGYQHLSGDENRLAGEVLATLVGNKGEDLLLKHAGEFTKGADPNSMANSFRERLSDMAVRDVFGINGLDKTGEVTLQVLKDFAEGSKIELGVNDISTSNPQLYKDLVSRANKASYLLESDPVKSLVGTEFLPKEGISLTEQVAGYFDSIGGFADSKEYGKVILDKKGAEDSLAHGIGRNKAIAYAAVKDVIENGVTLDYVKNHKNRGYDSALIAAPISIKGERYICEVVVKIKKNSVSRFYLHEVTPQKNLLQAVSLTNLGEIPSAPTGDIAKVLQKTIQAKFYLDLLPQSKHIPNMENSNLPADTNIALNGTALELTRLTQETFGPDYPFNVKFPSPVSLTDGDRTLEAVGMVMDASGNYVLRFVSDADYNHSFFSDVYPENRALKDFGSVETPENVKQAYESGIFNLNETLSESTFIPGERYEALLSQNKDAIFKAVMDTKERMKEAAEKVEEQIQSLDALTKALPNGVYSATTEVVFTPYSQKDIEVGGVSPQFKPTLVDIIVGKNPQTNEREVLYRLRDYPGEELLTTVDARSLAERHGNDPAFQKAEQVLMDIQNEKVREPALSWFNALSLEDKYRAFSFYRPSRPDESPDLVAPGYIEDSLDREHIWRTYEAAIGVPQDIAGVDDELVNKSINEMFEKTFALLSSTTLVQMQTELQLSGLGVKEEKTLSAEQDGIRYAPNGKVSNLSEEDWKLVRTPEFKQWFGDWENDPENASKVLDENGEPKALWHGSNRDFEEFDFSHLGQNLGGGEWHDRKTDEKVPDDSEKAFFFSSSKEQAISYTLLAQYRHYEEIRNDLDNLIMTLSAGRVFIPFKTKAELHETLERTSQLVPELKPILDEINANPQRKPVTDIIDTWLPDDLSAIRDALIARREPIIKSVHEMDRGGLSNLVNNTTRQMETVVSVINDIERLRRNDATVKNEIGTFERFSFSIFGASGNQEMDIYFDEGRCKVWIDKGKPVFLDEQNDEFVKNLCETMLSKCNAAISRVNNEIVNTGYTEDANLYRVFLNIRNPLSHDYESSPFPDKYKDTQHTTGYVAARQTAKAIREGNDGVIYQNIRDPFLSDSYGVFNPEQIKIAGKEHEIKVNFTPMEVEHSADKTLEIIVTAFTGGEEMTRAAFYRATQSLSDAEFASLKEDVKTVSLDVYAEKRSAMEGATPEQIEKERERNERSVEGLSRSWFRPWTRLAGRIENDIEMKISAEGLNAVDETYFASLCESYAAREEYAPYLDKEFKGFVCNRCKELYLDYSKIPDSLKTDEMMNEILDGYPYILESKEWDMMGTAYELGKKGVAMTLDEGPTHENGYIGGEVKWSSYLPINGPVLQEGRITGIGQIDYKDCTNCYFIVNDKQKAINVYQVPSFVRRQAFEQVYIESRYGKVPSQRNNQNESIKETKNYSIMPNENVREPIQSTLRSLGTYSAYELKKILDNVVLPAKGTDAEFDKAYEDIDKALTPGWSRDLNEGQIKKYLLDVVYGLPNKVQDFITEAAGGLSLGKTIFDETPCDVYTLGFSTKTLDDFLLCMPPQTTVVVDMRNYPKNRYQPHFNDTSLSKTLGAKGIKYINLSEKNEDSFELVRQEILANPGKVLICSSESKPGKAYRGRELGPMLERSGLSVGHITQPFDVETKTWLPTPSVMTQAELTNMLLSNIGKEMANGSYRQVSFDEKGNPVLVAGASLKDKERRELVDRNIVGRWNYGSKGEIVETETPGYDSALIAASQQAHFTFVFRVGRPSADERVAIEAAGVNCIQISIPDDPQKLTSPEYTHELIYGNKGIMDAFIRKVLAQSHADPENFNPDNIVVNIEGANIARITNKPMVSGHVTEEELTHAGLEEYYKLGGREAGVTLARPSNATEDEFNTFIYNFLYEMNHPSAKSFMGEEIRQDNPYTIGKVITIGQSGTGYAAVLAAQKMGLEWKVQAPKGFPVVIENETLSGKTVKDQAMFCNRFKQGLSVSLSEDDRRMQIDHIQSQGQNLSGPGLTDRQVLVLSELGYSNSDILTMVDLAVYNKVNIKEQPMKAPDGNTVMSGGENFLEFIQNCVEGYGLGERKNPEMLTELTLLQLTQAEQDVDKMIFNDRRNGIGVVTVANPMYPTQLRVFEGYTTREESEGYQMFEGSVSAGKVVTEIKQERPAILRFKGNYEATRLDKVAVTGNAFSSPEARHYAEKVGQELAGNDIAIVTSLRPTTAKEHSVLITSKTFLGKEFDAPTMYQSKRYTQTSSREDSETIARNAAISRGAAAILFSPNGLGYKEDQDQIQRVVESGGVVFSIAPFGAEEGTQEDFEKAGKLSCAFAGTAIVVDSKEADMPMSPVDEAKLAASGMYVVDYPGLSGVDYRLKGNEDALKEGAVSIDFFEKGVASVLESAKATSESTAIEIQEAKFDEMAEARAKKDTTKVMNVDYFTLSVVRKGTEQVFIVPENYPDVRQAVKNTYGENVCFAENQGIAKRNLMAHVAVVGGENVRTFDGYTGTQVQDEPVYSIPLFYTKGEINSIFNAPKGTPGLIPLKQRVENKQTFDYFLSLMKPLEKKFTEAVAPHTAENTPVPQRPLRFENAFYPVISQHSVEIYQGEELRAKVSLDDRGRLRVQNFGRLVDDLTEYKGSSPDLLPNYNRQLTKADMLEMAARVECVLMGVPAEESEMFALATREEREDIQNRLANNFTTLSEDNLDVAASDILNAYRQGLLVEFQETPGDKRTAIAAIIGEQSSIEKQIKKIVKQGETLDKQLADAEKARDAAYGEGYSVEQYEDLDKKIDEINDSKSSVLDALTSLRKQFATLEEHKERIVMADNIYISKEEPVGNSKTVTLFVDGLPVQYNPGKINKNTDFSLADKAISEIKSEKETQKVSFEEAIEKIENNSITLKTIGKIYDIRHLDKPMEKAAVSEIKPNSLSNGRYIVERNGKKAYADEQFNIRSEFYDDLGPWNGRFGLATQDGKHNYINPAGEPIVEKWFDSIGKTVSEKTFVIRIGEDFGVAGEDGKLFGGKLFHNAHPSHDGWCLVREGIEKPELAGKFNYINKDGLFLFKDWLDDASDFKNGEAVVVKKGTKMTVDTKGKEVIKQNVEGPEHDVAQAPAEETTKKGKGRGGRS